MKRLIVILWLFDSTLLLHAENWWETLRPGISRAEIIRIAGNPSSSSNGVEVYKRAKGHIDCAYRGTVLESLTYYDPPGGGVWSRLYSTENKLKDPNVEEHRAFLRKGNFATLPKFSGRYVYTRKYRGKCYEVDGSFLVIEPIISLLAGHGYFADKVARSLLVDTNGTEKVLYRAADHWKELKPPNLSDTDVRRRGLKLRQAGARVIGARIADIFGQSDSFMGSGVDYRLFYLEDALIVASCEEPDETITSIGVEKPGFARMTLDEWLKSTHSPATKPAPPR